MTRANFRVGLIGYGTSGRGIHSRLIRQWGGEVVAIVVRSPQRREQAHEDWPNAVLHDDVRALLADPRACDVVVIASPSGVHVDHALQVAAAGVPFVVDKPIAVDADGARRVCQEAGEVPFTVFHNRRWDGENLTLGALLSSGELGTVHTFERRWERWRPVPRARWKETDLRSGGLLLDLGAHLVDSAVQFFGPVASVYAELRSLTTPATDDVFLSLTHHSDVVSRLWAGSLVGAPGPRTRVLGSQGAYLVTSFEEEASPFELLDHNAGEGDLGWLVRERERTAVPRVGGGHVDFYRALGHWLAGAGPVPVDPWDAVRTAMVLDAAVVSARQGRRVAVPRAEEIPDRRGSRR